MSDKFGTSDEELIEEVKKFCGAHDYTVDIHRIDGSSCRAIFPEPSLLLPDKKRLTAKYTIKYSTPFGVEVECNETSEFFSCPMYSMRMLIMCDIMYKMRRLFMHESLIRYYDEDGKEKEKLGDLLPAPLSKEEENREGLLSGLIVKGIEDHFPPEYEDVAETHGVLTGYRLLKSYF